ncbi:MAG: 4Fe-4S ferredoxin [Verrucomicrobiota bacterium]
MSPSPAPERPKIDVDIACVGFGPAMGGFLTTLSQHLVKPDGTPVAPSAVQPGLPPQVVCYERADDISFGVSGVVTAARALRASFPTLDQAEIPMAAAVQEEKVIYLLDAMGASRRSWLLRSADGMIRAGKSLLPYRDEAVILPWTPAFLRKDGGMLLSLGQFMQWVGNQIQGTGVIQIWPASPVAEVILRDRKVEGIRLADQGVDKTGQPGAAYAPGMEVRAGLTVIGDGPVGAISRQLDQQVGMPPGHHCGEWALGMKCVVELPAETELKAGTILHTLGYPEPEIFGFLYVHPGGVASLGIFIPSWFNSPVRTAYRYMQHWMLHPFLWRQLRGGKLRSWGAKTLGESGRRGEPYLVGDGFARIGESSGTTNVLTNSGVDEAWASGAQLGEAVLELLRERRPFTKENLERSYVQRRRSSWLDAESRAAERSRDGFQHGLIPGLLGVLLASLTGGRFSLFRGPVPAAERVRTYEDYFAGRLSRPEMRQLKKECDIKGTSLHAAVMQRCGWPAIPYDGQLLVSHQDALLLGGKVQAPPGYADHVVFLYPHLCEQCGTKVCIELCSGQAISPGTNGVPAFDREKCIHCGACLWNCAERLPNNLHRTNIDFRPAPGGLHSSEN